MIRELDEDVGIMKVTRIMSHKETQWMCCNCGQGYDHKNKANGCCSGQKHKDNIMEREYLYKVVGGENAI
jgi:hypothetical protein